MTIDSDDLLDGDARLRRGPEGRRHSAGDGQAAGDAALEASRAQRAARGHASGRAARHGLGRRRSKRWSRSSPREFSAGAKLLGDVGQAREMLTGAMPPEQVADILADVFGTRAPTSGRTLGGISESVLTDYLVDEHPLTTTYHSVEARTGVRRADRRPSAARHAQRRAVRDDLAAQACRRRRSASSRRPCGRTSPARRARLRARQPHPHRRHHQQSRASRGARGGRSRWSPRARRRRAS